MDFVVLNRWAAERAKIDVPHIFVSIYSSGGDAPNLPTANLNCGGAIYLQFDDTDWDEDLENPDGSITQLRAMTPNAAKTIWSYVDATLSVEPEDLVVIHCDAGVSRSPAVAAALSRHYLGYDDLYFKQYRPNMHVYRTMLENTL